MKATQLHRKHNGENSVTSLWRNSFFVNMRLTYEDKASIKLDHQQKNINPVDYAVGGALQQDVYRSWVWRISKTECVPAGPVSTNNWSTKQLKTVVKLHGGHIEQLFTWLSCCCVKFSPFYLDIHANTHFHCVSPLWYNTVWVLWFYRII